ncbi:hypothetical protein CAC42_1669 [Sphaceloma murrayae]|uniref:Uncharacterized protein n=1 Tax=Sphaceloma murrayae TaxID=2082308 RepID=A0A2K1QHL7_9PEZI|nr:hypothetical protein CAC42_1669 [Sphaceloma murrayae]
MSKVGVIVGVTVGVRVSRPWQAPMAHAGTPKKSRLGGLQTERSTWLGEGRLNSI